jgi:hypothetical protein
LVILQVCPTSLTFSSFQTLSYTEGPQFSLETSLHLLQGEDFILPKIVFISYASEDHRAANDLYDALRKRGHKPWMDKRDLFAGQEWETEIRKAIGKADYFVALMSSETMSQTDEMR